jgi:hypothetical protein
MVPAQMAAEGERGEDGIAFHRVLAAIGSGARKE